MKKIIYTLILLCLYSVSNAQEIKCKAKVISEQVTGVDTKIFSTFEQAIENFVNNRKWGKDVFENEEKIECVYTIIITKIIEGVEGGYLGRISVQSSRPVYNTSYNTNLVNYSDKNFAFKYVQYQPLEFNDNVIAGPDPLVSNLTATIAYYTYIMLGLDYDSYSLKGGTDFFNKALNIANNAPEQNQINGWKASESQKNRFWLIDQILNQRFVKMRESIYKYYRHGLDLMTTDPETARNTIYSTYLELSQINTENPSSIWIQFFFNAKSDEIINFMAKATMQDKQKYVPLLSQMDVSNATKYAELLKN
ncbi:MAG: DUF4835 family protein [Chitinophagaceae bacterium]